MKSGTVNISTQNTKMSSPPQKSQGFTWPKRVFVRSISAPHMMSFIASQTLDMNTMTPMAVAEMPSTSV